MSGDHPNTVLLTRPLVSSEAMAAEVKKLGFEVLIEPMLSIEPVAFDLEQPERYQGLLLTSANAIACLEDDRLSKDMPVYTVGNQTAEAAKDQGWKNLISAKGAGADLVDLVKAHVDPGKGPLLHVRGVNTALPIHILLSEAGYNVDLLTVYRAVPASVLSETCRYALSSGQIEIIPFFSKRTAEAFLRLVDEHRLSEALSSIKSLSISANVLECVRTYTWRQMEVSQSPDLPGMLAGLERLKS